MGLWSFFNTESFQIEVVVFHASFDWGEIGNLHQTLVLQKKKKRKKYLDFHLSAIKRRELTTLELRVSVAIKNHSHFADGNFQSRSQVTYYGYPGNQRQGWDQDPSAQSQARAVTSYCNVAYVITNMVDTFSFSSHSQPFT